MTRRQKRKMISALRPFGGLLLVGACICIILTVNEAMASKPGSEFVNNASIGGQFEIESSRLALQKSQNNDVKQFAQHMLDDHTKLSNELDSVISNANPPVPVPNNKLDPKHQKLLDILNEASGNDFDGKYIKAQTEAHDEAISLFKEYSERGDNQALKTFASKTLPMLHEHKKNIPRIE